MMKFKDSKLIQKLINNYYIDFGSESTGIHDFLELEEFQAYSKTYKKLKEGYYPKKILLIGYPKSDKPIYLVFKKIGGNK